jgi:hypothetical protein
MDIRTWKKRRSPGELCLRSPEGLEITIRERVRPIAPLRTFVGDVKATAMRTLEGEDASIAMIDRDNHVQVIAVIEGDDFQTVVDGRAPPVRREPLRLAVTHFASKLPLGLGSNRVRSVRHTGPAAWREERDGMTTRWTSPANDAVIDVFPARPLGEKEDVLALALLVAERADPLTVERPPRSEALVIGSLRGKLERATGHYGGSQRVVLAAELADTKYRYYARIDRDARADLDAAFFALLQSFVSVVPARGAMAAVNAVGFWAD